MFALSFGPDAVCLTEGQETRCLSWDDIGAAVLGEVSTATTVHVSKSGALMVTATTGQEETHEIPLSAAEFFELFTERGELVKGVH